MNRSKYALLCALIIATLPLCACRKPQRPAALPADSAQPVLPDERQSAEDSQAASNFLDPEVIYDFGKLDYPPLLFDNQGWITRSNGEYEYTSSSGTPIVKDRGFVEMSFFIYQDDTVQTALLSYSDDPNPGPGTDAALLPYDYWPEDKAYGGGGVNLAGIFYLDENNAIQQLDKAPVPEAPDLPQYNTTLFKSGVQAQDRFNEPFHIYLSNEKLLIGPYEAGSAVSYYHMHPSQLAANIVKEPNSRVGELFWMFEEGKGYYICSTVAGKYIGPFDAVEITDPAYMGARIGDTYLFYDINLSEVYRADIESGGAIAAGKVPVKTDGTWKLIAVRDLYSFPVSFTGSVQSYDLQSVE